MTQDTREQGYEAGSHALSQYEQCGLALKRGGAPGRDWRLPLPCHCCSACSCCGDCLFPAIQDYCSSAFASHGNKGTRKQQSRAGSHPGSMFAGSMDFTSLLSIYKQTMATTDRAHRRGVSFSGSMRISGGLRVFHSQVPCESQGAYGHGRICSVGLFGVVWKDNHYEV